MEKQVTMSSHGEASFATPSLKTSLKALGILQIISGTVGLIFGIVEVALIYSAGFIAVGQGIWCSIWVIIAGAIGCKGGFGILTDSVANLYLGFSIVSTIFMVILFILIILFGGFLWMLVATAFSLIFGICGACFIGCTRSGNCFQN